MRKDLDQIISLAAAGIILVTNLSFTQAQIKNNQDITTQQRATAVTKVSGKLILKTTKREIPNSNVFFVCKSKYIKTTTNENGNFTLEIPNELIEQRNVLYFSFDKTNDVGKEADQTEDSINSNELKNKTIIFEKNEKLENKEFQIDHQYVLVGDIAILSEAPPDYYYFDGKSVSKNKFNKLKKANPDYQYFYFKNKEAEIISGKRYLSRLQLLYSH